MGSEKPERMQKGSENSAEAGCSEKDAKLSYGYLCPRTAPLYACTKRSEMREAAI